MQSLASRRGIFGDNKRNRKKISTFDWIYVVPLLGGVLGGGGGGRGAFHFE